MEGKGEGRSFAGFDGTGEEVDGKNFHDGPFGVCGEMISSFGHFFEKTNINAK